MDVINLSNRFSIPGSVEVSRGNGNLPRVLVTTELADAEIYLHGAHITQFAPKGAKPLLFLSEKSYFAAGRAIRGGVPLIFPWFGPNSTDPTFPAHGFARTRSWELTATEKTADGVRVEMRMSADSDSRLLWPREFELRMSFSIGQSLGLKLTVRNTGDRPFRYESAFHTYLAVSDVRQVRIEGLAAREYLDKTELGARKTQTESPFGLTGETDRLYLNTPDTVVVTDSGGSSAGGPRVIGVAKENSSTTVLWNPWIAKAAAMTDFGDHEWPAMLCVETANASENAMTLEPGEEQVMSATIGEA